MSQYMSTVLITDLDKLNLVKLCRFVFRLESQDTLIIYRKHIYYCLRRLQNPDEPDMHKMLFFRLRY